ncbi:serine hydrolase domain-containing protein [Priestia taiwanensis]|uniref:Penicillin-binding protein n=1 Tax=Priestia taiwanensis TaxID=1347902 RepID=A0A917AL65_9BACI|nr:serine hydrolase [Priestia taiwanensis]MBM7362189.1 CubicO group peptidase (beta-lactamase class C family) [Priestia taiwanensis]GGE60091.1 penicillin-binding protein [Priestia taiwanensis]
MNEKSIITNEKLISVDSFIKTSKKRIRSLVISEKDTIIHEIYFHDEGFKKLHEMRSITKSVISTLIGIAIDQQLLTGVTQTLREIFKNQTMSTDIGNITIKQLLTMTSGIQITDKELLSLATKGNPMQKIFFANVHTAAPFSYKSIDPHLLSIILSHVTGKSAKQFGEEMLFSKLGIHTIHWPTDTLGHSIGSTGLSLSPRDLIKLGMLYLFGGEWNNTRILSADWIHDTVSVHEKGLSKYGKYGYLWWINSEKEYYNAAGFGGQYLYVYPKQEVTVVITADTTLPHDDTSEIFETFILPSLTNKTCGGGNLCMQ